MRRFAALLEGLSVVQDIQLVSQYVSSVLPLAREHRLSAYDAAYLELSRFGTVLRSQPSWKTKKQREKPV